MTTTPKTNAELLDDLQADAVASSRAGFAQDEFDQDLAKTRAAVLARMDAWGGRAGRQLVPTPQELSRCETYARAMCVAFVSDPETWRRYQLHAYVAIEQADKEAGRETMVDRHRREFMEANRP